MPALEMAQETGKLVSWMKKEGEQVRKGEMLLEVETDKAVVEIEAAGDGLLSGITAQRGRCGSGWTDDRLAAPARRITANRVARAHGDWAKDGRRACCGGGEWRSRWVARRRRPCIAKGTPARAGSRSRPRHRARVRARRRNSRRRHPGRGRKGPAEAGHYDCKYRPRFGRSVRLQSDRRFRRSVRL